MIQRIQQMARSLFGRLLVSQFILVAAVLIIAVAALTIGIRPVQRELQYRRLGESQMLAVLYARTLRSGQNGGPPSQRAADAPFSQERLINLLDEQASAQNIRTFLLNAATDEVIYDSAGQLTGTVATDRFSIRWRGRFPTGEELVPGQVPAPVRGSTTINDRRWLVSGSRLNSPRLGLNLLLVLAAPEPNAWGTVTDLLQSLPALPTAGILAGLVVVIGLISVWLARSVARSLDTVVDGTRKIALGDLAYRVPVDGRTPDELRTLAVSFNRMAEEVQRNRQAQRDFVANVSHDLRTPLTSIHGFAQALLDGTANNPEAQERAVQIIHDESGRLNRLVNELIELTRLDSGRLQLHRQPLDLVDYLRWLVESYRAKADAAGVRLSFAADGTATVLADPDRLNRIFGNLLDNALKYTPRGGAITVSLAPTALTQPGWQVSLTDTGPGIPAQDIPYLFDRFYQVDKARSGATGSGLGLAIVRELVSAHGGEVGVESVQGLGSRFWVWLPASTPPESPDGSGLQGRGKG